jgi:hypothetical protein
MSLGYTQPPEELARELREVARDANLLSAALMTSPNVELPSNFPKDQLLEISRSLAQLPNGTAEGCGTTLKFARDYLPTIRRKHFLSENRNVSTSNAEAVPPLLRNFLIDVRLRDLMTSTTTALDAYRHLDAEAPPEEPKPEAEIDVPGNVTEGAIAQSLRLEADLAAAGSTVEEVGNPSSPRVDSLKRQLQDGQALNRLARAALRMPRIVVSWYRNVVAALKEYPSILRATANSLETVVDITEIGFKKWHHLKLKMIEVLIKELRVICDTLREIADILERPKRYLLNPQSVRILMGSLPIP